MNYYRRYIGDYGKATTLLSLAEHGAYALMLDHYYAAEGPLPNDLEDVYRIARAVKPDERKAVDRVLAKYFTKEQDGYHNSRADEELERAKPAIEAAKRNGSKGGRPPKENPLGYQNQTRWDSYDENPSGSQTPPKTKPSGIAIRAGDPSSNPQEPTPKNQDPTPNPNPEKRIPGDKNIGAHADGIALADCKINPDPETPAAILSSVCIANSIQATPFNPFVIEWAEAGVNVQQLKAAIATARMRKGDEPIPPKYIDTILKGDAKSVDTAWRTDDNKANTMATQLGIKPAKAGESREEFHQRILAAMSQKAINRVV